MKFSSDENHIWIQHALCLEAAGQYSRAFSMMKEVIRLAKDQTRPKLIAARIAYQRLNKVLICPFTITFGRFCTFSRK